MRDLFLQYNSNPSSFPHVRVTFLSFKREFQLGCYSAETLNFSLCINSFFYKNLDMPRFSRLRKFLWYGVIHCPKIVLVQKVGDLFHTYIHPGAILIACDGPIFQTDDDFCGLKNANFIYRRAPLADVVVGSEIFFFFLFYTKFLQRSCDHSERLHFTTKHK